MTYEENGDRVRLDMSRDEFVSLLLMLGEATGAAFGNPDLMWRLIRFVNALNRTNPNFTPYDVPERGTKKP